MAYSRAENEGALPAYRSPVIADAGCGYHIEIIYLHVSTTALALKRIAARVKQGGDSVPKTGVVRRFARSRANFDQIYKTLANGWAVYDNSGRKPKLLESRP